MTEVFVHDEIASQPECWEKAAQLAPAAEHLLPRAGEAVAVVGCGTSYNVALAYARLREVAGLGTTDAMVASEVLAQRRYDRYLFVSRSGTTSEVLDALRQVPPGAPATSITARPSAPLANATTAVDLSFADERSVVQTRFATSVLALLRSHLGEDLARVVSEGRDALAAALPAAALAARRTTFLGRGWTVGLAHEAALKLREAARAWTESYPAGEVRHGPLSVLDDESVVWCLGAPPEGLAADVQATGATFMASRWDPLADLVLVQRVAVERAMRQGLDPDHPRHLSFSVVLGAGGQMAAGQARA